MVGLSTVLRPKGILKEQTHGQEKGIAYISSYTGSIQS